MNLYDINNEIEQAVNNIMDSMNPETGEVDESLVHVLEDLQMQKEEKLDNLGAYIKNLLAEAKMLKAEEDALKARRESKEKQASNLKNYLASVLDGKPFESSRVAISWRKSDEVQVEDIDLLPEEFVKSKTTYDADKTAIKKAIKAGQEVRGAWLKEKNNIQIK